MQYGIHASARIHYAIEDLPELSPGALIRLEHRPGKVTARAMLGRIGRQTYRAIA